MLHLPQFVAALFCMLCAPGFAAGQTLVQAPQLVVEIQPTQLNVSGDVSSIAHENILRETAARRFADRSAEFDVNIRGAMPPGWALISDLTFQALAETRSSTATISDSGISIRGFAHDDERWAAAVRRIESVLPEGWTLFQKVEEIAPTASIGRQCIELFRTAMRGRTIEFERASWTLGTAAGPLLDELIQIVADCPGSLVEITGHTDSSGTESTNLALSKARANAVGAYFVAGGILQDRISATGAGSARPLTAENSAQARQLNRRIEIELRFP